MMKGLLVVWCSHDCMENKIYDVILKDIGQNACLLISLDKSYLKITTDDKSEF